jgi:CheY-like chemotaxis protein
MRRYLVVDDSVTIRKAMAAAVKQAGGHGSEVVEAADAVQALEAFRKGPYDAIFLDMMLPGGPGGLRVLQAMLQQDHAARIVLVTGLPQDHPEVVEAINHGAFACIPKPVRGDAVQRVLHVLAAESGRFGRIK